MSQVKGFITGLLLGGLAGAGAMLLFAPKSGKRTRAKIQHQYDELRDQVAESLEDADEEVYVKAQQIASDAQRKMKELQRRGQEMSHMK